jgi:hypothetical protein
MKKDIWITSGPPLAFCVFALLIVAGCDNQHHRVMEQPLRGEAPTTQSINLDAYLKLKLAYTAKGSQVKPWRSLYHVNEGDDRRSHMLCLVSFDNRWAWIGELTSFKTKESTWDWVARYRLARGPAVDQELGIPDILAERSKIIGGVKYGMTVAQLIGKKGVHFKAADHQEPGTYTLFFNDVVVTVRGWRPGTKEGRVVRAEPMTEHIKQYNWLRDLPYEDEK